MSKQELRSLFLSKKIKKHHNVSKEDGSTRKQQGNIIESPPWSDLHTSLLDQIAGKLCYVDQVSFHAVCKSWNAAQYKVMPADLMTWVVRVSRTSPDMFQCHLYPMSALFNPDIKQCRLNGTEGNFDPKPIVVQNIYLDQCVGSYPWCWDTNIDITCNYGWILFNLPTRDYTATIFLFYSPLTKRVMVLPQLIHSRGTTHKLITCFSAEPDSPDFVLLVARHSDIDTVSTYCHVQGKWSTKKFNNLFSLVLSPDSVVVYLRELFFFVHASGWMTSYNITSGTWKRECVSSDMTISTSGRRYAFESNGELMLVHDSELFNYTVRRFDWSDKRWLPLNNLSDRTLFVGLNSISVNDIEEKEPNNLVLPNQIHVLDGRWYDVYDLKGGKLSESKIPGTKSTFWFKPPDNIVTKKY
ncbi:hypothetical protein POM88_052081 [Heracleum sosnowskyi]|uniref:KIB1-4 beta-propeller domain-containing protein n=1 Tax=Heracleum sosnowskyi TaxID=360622 RepID=A0AAD8LYB5_9APIA|nr:hypothetical protein POM88_052081 [Heracleum sosnowskyi]